ncbi:hypothetical protein SAMN02745216_00826 [Desulfatibacillum alkenivorans DSM 16219]|jgi:hypothetical protein|uniref:Uncharacterized protein n=1 Tax=Desulfatibacillum alkenivorans DSM 16219 TaxID=1121393 RepID=A0A1M6FI10_9BACT|nr:hypothetical protein [Desulfatibacillum alkenivorans]SHI97293.1 hypothetical protein SAMN02745216_00826 [Desulfatibacillum alkenivorans DSM 16219]
MNAIIFPYTYITDDEIQALNLLFGTPTLYLASDMEMPPPIMDAYRKKLVSLSLPLEDQTDKRLLRSVLAECRSWAGAMDLRAAAVQSSQQPLTEEAFSANIRAAIQKQSSSSPGGEESPPLADQVFLLLAQALDFQHYDMESSLKKLTGQESALLKELSEPGEKEARKVGVSLSNADTPRVRNLSRRMHAWARMLGEDPAASGLFITFTADALDLLLDKMDPQPLSFSVNDFSWPPAEGEAADPWKEAFAACISRFTAGEADASQAVKALEQLPALEAGEAVLRIAFIEKEPCKAFSQALGKNFKQGEASKVKNTVLVCIE